MDGFFKFICSIVIIMVAGVAAIVGFGVHLSIEENKYIESLSPEELKEYKQQQQKIRQSYIKKYDVVSVNKYTDVTGNMRDIDTQVCYSFSYIQGNTLKHVNGFVHCEYGLYKVTIGDKNQYIIDTYGETTYYLQLTKETLANLGNIN